MQRINFEWQQFWYFIFPLALGMCTHGLRYEQGPHILCDKYQ